MIRNKEEHAKRVIITIVVTQEWHEDDFDGNLQALEDHEISTPDIRRNLPYWYGSLHDLLESATISHRSENITYTVGDHE